MNSSRRVIIAGIFAMFTLTACGSGTSFSPSDDIQIPIPADEITSTNSAVGIELIPQADRQDSVTLEGTTLEGEQLTTSEFSDRITLINSWASWCAPCLEELPELAATARDPQFADIAFVGLNVKDNRDAAQALAAELPYPSLFDPSGELLPRIPGVPPAALPSTVILDRKGLIAVRIIGPIPPGELAKTIDWVKAN